MTNTVVVTESGIAVVAVGQQGPAGAGNYAVPAITLGTASAEGVAPTTLRTDATILAFDATDPSTQAFDDIAVVGVEAVAARRDHKHAMPAASTASSVGLGNVNNTSDANKPVSTAQAAADDAARDAAKAYADGLVIGLIDDRGNYDASVNTFPATGGSGTAGAVLKGDLWLVSVTGTLGGVAVGIGDSVRALVDTPGQTASNWSVFESNLGYVPENSANKGVSGGYVGKTLEKINFWNAARTFMSFIANAATAARTYTFPDKDITVAGTTNETFVNPNLGAATADTIKTGDGTVALPAWSFNSDPDTGFYRIGANNIGITVNGAKVVDVSASGVGVTGTITATAGISGDLSGSTGFPGFESQFLLMGA